MSHEVRARPLGVGANSRRCHKLLHPTGEEMWLSGLNRAISLDSNCHKLGWRG